MKPEDNELLMQACGMADELDYFVCGCPNAFGREHALFWNDHELYQVEYTGKGISVYYLFREGPSHEIGCACTPFEVPLDEDTALYEIPDVKTFAKYLANGRAFAKTLGAVPLSTEEINDYVDKF